MPPMTERYDLLVTSMHQAATVVLVCFGIAAGLLFARWLIRWLLEPASINAGFRRVVYDVTDLFFVGVFVVLIVVSK